MASGELARVRGGKDKKLKLELTRHGRKLVRNHAKTKLQVEIGAAELAEAAIQKAKAVR